MYLAVLKFLFIYFTQEFSIILSQGSQDFLVLFPTWEDVQEHILFEQKRRYKEF